MELLGKLGENKIQLPNHYDTKLTTRDSSLRKVTAAVASTMETKFSLKKFPIKENEKDRYIRVASKAITNTTLRAVLVTFSPTAFNNYRNQFLCRKHSNKSN